MRDRRAQAVGAGHLGGVERHVRAGVPGHEVAERVGHRLEEGLRHAGWQRDAERVAQPGGVVDGRPPVLRRDTHRDDLPGVVQPGQPGLDVASGGALAAAGQDAVDRQRPERAEQVEHVVGVARRPLGREPLQLGLGAGDLLGVEQIAQCQALARAEQLGEQAGVERQGGGATLGQRGVALVQELRDVAEQQRLGERRGGAALDVDDGDPARVDVAHQVDQAGHVEDVLHALAHGLEHDREGRVLAGHLEQLRGALALLPQRLAAVGATPGKEQRPGRTLAEACREQRRTADLLGDQAPHVIGVEGDQVEQLTTDPPLAHAVELVELDVGQAQHDAVVAVHRLHVDAEPVAHPGAHRQRPGRVHLRAERREDGDPPVAELVAEPLDDDRPVVGHVTGGLALLAQVAEQVVGGPVVETGRHHPLACGLWRQRLDLADERTDGPAQLGGAAERVALPERQPPRQAGGRRDEHPVVGDVLDAPGARAQGEQVADPRLVDHLLVELADPAAGAFAGREEDGVQPAVGDGAARGDGEPLGAPAAGEGVGQAVPGDAGAQLGELVAGVPTREHVEHRLEHRAGEGGVGGRPPGEGEHVVDGPLVERAHRDDLLGEHVERGVGQVQRLDLAREHALDDDRRLHEVAAELREEHPAADGADLVAGPADPLQPGGHRRRRLDLHHEVDGPHVDAELEAARGDHGGQPTRLEVLLDAWRAAPC